MNNNVKTTATSDKTTLTTTNINTGIPPQGTINTKCCSPRMDRLVKIPGVLRASDLLPQVRTPDGQPCLRSFGQAEERQKVRLANPHSIGHAQQCIAAAIQDTGTKDMRRFVKGLMSDPEVARAISSKVYPGQPYPIELIRRASRIAQNHSGWTQPKRDVLHAAILLTGVREVLSEQGVATQTGAGNVLFGIVCIELHRLDEVQAAMGHMLRLSQDWGRAEEEGTEFADELKALVACALAAVGMSSPLQSND